VRTSRCLETNVYCNFTISAFERHITIYYVEEFIFKEVRFFSNHPNKDKAIISLQRHTYSKKLLFLAILIEIFLVSVHY
jgi:hypothetical protein